MQLKTIIINIDKFVTIARHLLNTQLLDNIIFEQIILSSSIFLIWILWKLYTKIKFVSSREHIHNYCRIIIMK
jgi:hypothetical protein